MGSPAARNLRALQLGAAAESEQEARAERDFAGMMVQFQRLRVQNLGLMEGISQGQGGGPSKEQGDAEGGDDEDDHTPSPESGGGGGSGEGNMNSERDEWIDSEEDDDDEDDEDDEDEGALARAAAPVPAAGERANGAGAAMPISAGVQAGSGSGSSSRAGGDSSNGGAGDEIARVRAKLLSVLKLSEFLNAYAAVAAAREGDAKSTAERTMGPRLARYVPLMLWLVARQGGQQGY